MEMTGKAIAKILSMRGIDILSRKEVLYTLLEDMLPEHKEDRNFIQMTYTDEIGRILKEAANANHDIRERYYRELNTYLHENNGLNEKKREKFINIFRTALRRKTVEVNKYKDYKDALRTLKKEFGPVLDKSVVQDFVDENKLFSRFSLTIDDVIRDLQNI